MSTATTTKTAFASSDGVVNGIDTEAVHALIESVEAELAKGMTHWRVASNWQGGTLSRAQVDGFAIGGVDVPRHLSINIDEPLELGGTNGYANPSNLVRQQPPPKPHGLADFACSTFESRKTSCSRHELAGH